MAEETIPMAVTGITAGARTYTNPIGATFERVVNRPPQNAGGNNHPIERYPVAVDARVVVMAKDPHVPLALDADAYSVEAEFIEADGEGTGSVEIGDCVPGNATTTLGHNDEAGHEEEHLLKGATIDWAVSL